MNEQSFFNSYVFILILIRKKIQLAHSMWNTLKIRLLKKVKNKVKNK